VAKRAFLTPVAFAVAALVSAAPEANASVQSAVTTAVAGQTGDSDLVLGRAAEGQIRLADHASHSSHASHASHSSHASSSH
jgi:hypothetical protein